MPASAVPDDTIKSSYGKVCNSLSASQFSSLSPITIASSLAGLFVGSFAQDGDSEGASAIVYNREVMNSSLDTEVCSMKPCLFKDTEVDDLVGAADPPSMNKPSECEENILVPELKSLKGYLDFSTELVTLCRWASGIAAPEIVVAALKPLFYSNSEFNMQRCGAFGGVVIVAVLRSLSFNAEELEYARSLTRTQAVDKPSAPPSKHEKLKVIGENDRPDQDPMF
ncbi:hypothetical protein M5K25_011806 [Dendrobium thyrsiflorum]|uniref:Uncharacterized protein n=1 Tax=Dendrobium thyrsiflorum TaxID=117978 RepID=A0ABD0VAQ9_DENTH